MPRLIEKPAKTILTKQTSGFLTSTPYPFTHSLSAYTGCGFGKTYCGRYCYAPTLPNWQYAEIEDGEQWGDVVFAKSNAAELLHNELQSNATRRLSMRIFMSPTTDPYQPIESKQELTKKLLQVFTQFDDLDLLVIQTRSPLVERDFDIIRTIPYAFLSMTIETDLQSVITQYGGGVSVDKRFEVVQRAVKAGIQTQVAVSPTLPYSNNFLERLLATGAHRFIVDSFSDGDGARGSRTAKSEFASMADYNWKDNTNPIRLMYDLEQRGATVRWSSEGFCSIPNLNSFPQKSVKPVKSVQTSANKIDYVTTLIDMNA